MGSDPPSDPDVAVILTNSRAFSAQDVDGMLACYAPDAVVEDKRHGGLLGTFAGHADLRAYYEGIFHMVTTMHEDLTVLAARDGVVVADCHLRGRLAADPEGREMTAPYGLLVSLRDQLIARIEIYGDGREALEVSGLA